MQTLFNRVMKANFSVNTKMTFIFAHEFTVSKSAGENENGVSESKMNLGCY